MILTGTGTDLLTLHPIVGHKVSFILFNFFFFHWDTPVIVVLSFLLGGCSGFFTFKCMELEGGDTRSPLGLCSASGAVTLNAVFSD